MDILLSLVPIALLIVLMAVLKQPGDRSSLITLVVTAIIAVLGFGMSVHDMTFSFLYGATKAISPILIIILMAIFSYNTLLLTGKMEVIKSQFSMISTDRSIQVLLLTWGFGGILEAMAGFGTAVAIPAAILISLGYKPVFSAVVCLIANSVATTFGAIGTPVIVLANETGLDVNLLSSNVVLQLAPLMFIIPFIIVYMADSRRQALVKNIVLSLVTGVVSLGGQYAAARFMGAESPAIIGSLLSIIVIVVAAKFVKSDKPENAKKITAGELLNAWSVYLLILFLVIVTSPLFPTIREALSSTLVTTINFPVEAIKPYKISWLTHAGLLLFLGTVIGGLVQGASIGGIMKTLWNTAKSLKATIITVVCLVGFSTVMDYAGMITVIAGGLAAATGAVYPLFAPLVGGIGTFITGSDTSANILFGKMQSTVAGHINVSPDWLAASNTVGATGGKIISPQSIAIATSACNLQGKEGEILKQSLPWAVLYIVVAGVTVYLLV
ncbi:MAG: L-lactate permease [Prevotella sp.]